jgi:hypothetical protein
MDLRTSLDNKLLPLFATVLADSIQHAKQIKFDKNYTQQLTVVCIYCTIIELAHGEQALFNEEQTTGLPVLLRSIFEAYADLRALIDDPDYDKRMYATFLHEKIRFLNYVLRTPANPFFTGVQAGMNVEEEIKKLEAEVTQFKSRGKGPLRNSDRFDSTKLENERQSIYWLLCLEGHNNMSALDDRHIEKNGNEFNIALFKEAEPAALIRILDALLAVVIDSSIRVHNFFKTQATKQFENHKQMFNEYRDEYAPITNTNKPAEK